MAGKILDFSDAELEISIVAAPAAGSAPTFPTLADFLCAATNMTINTQVDKRETKVACGETLRTYDHPTGTISLSSVILATNTGNGYNFQTAGAKTPEGMAIKISHNPKASLTASVYEGIITNWKGTFSADAVDAEEIEIDIIDDWT
jgi:hypothetical protein